MLMHFAVVIFGLDRVLKPLVFGLGNQYIPNRSFGARRRVGRATLAGLYSDSMVAFYYLDLGTTD